MKRIGAVLGVLALVGTLGATETRVWTYAQGGAGFLLDDEIIIRFYPGQMFRFGNFVTIENPVVLGGSLWGAYKYASAFYTGEGFGIGAYVGEVVPVNAGFTPIDVYPLNAVIGVNAGNAKIGLNFKVGHASEGNASGTVIGFRPGITMDLGGGSGLDMAVFFDYAGGTDGTNSTSEMGFGLDGRYYGPIVLPMMIHFYRSNGSTTVDLRAGAGNTLNLGSGNVLATGFVGFNNFNNGKQFYLGSVLGGEFNVWRGLIVRGSISYDLIKYTSTSGGNSSLSFGYAGPFTLGAGYDLGFARVDLALSTDLITNGPFFLTGNSGSAMVTMLSILGKF